MAEYNLGTAHGTVKIDSDTTGVDKANQSLDNLSQKGQSTGQALQTVGTSMGVAGLAIAGGLGVAIATATTFEAELSGIKAVSGATAAEMDKISDAARKIGKDTAFSATEAAQAMQELAKAGLSTEEILGGAADATVALAAATGVDMPTAAAVASNAMNVFNIDAKDMNSVVDTIAQTANASAIDVSDFAISMQQVGGVAAMVGLDLDDMAVAIGQMGDMGYKGSDAGTSLKTAFLSLQPATKKQINLFRDLGLITEDGTNRFYDQNGSLKSLKDVQETLQSSLEGLSAAERQMALETIFGSDAIRAGDMMARNGAEGYDLFADKQAKTGTAAEQAKIRQDNFKNSLEQLKGSLEEAGISIGSVLIPGLRQLADWLGTLFDWFNNLPGPVQSMITWFLAGSAAVLLLGAGVIKFVNFASDMKGAITTIIGALTRKNTAEAASAASSQRSALASTGAWIAHAARVVGIWISTAASALAHAAQIAAIWIAETARAAATTVASWIATAATTIARWVAMAAAATLNALKVAAAWIATTAASAAAAVVSTATTVAKMIASWVLLAAQSALNAAKAAAAWLIATGTAMATAIASMAVAVAVTIGGWIAMAAGAMINAAILAAAWLIAFWPIALIVVAIVALAALLYIFWDEIVAAFKVAAAWIGEVMTGLWNAIKQAWDWIVQKFQEAWTWITEIFAGILEAITSAWDSIVEAFTKAKDWVVEKLTELWNKVVEIWNSIINWFKEIPGKIAAVFSGAAEWLVDKGRAILDGLWNGIKNVWNAVTGWFSQVGGWVKEKFSGALNWLVSAGGDLIRGLWNGIVSVKDWIMSKIGGFVSSILSGIKSFFGISSPSKETAWMGEMLGQGLAGGIEDSTRPAVNAAVSTAQQVLDGMEKALADGATLEAAIGSSLTPGAIASLRGAAPTLAATLDGLARPVQGTRASDTRDGTEAAFQKIVKMEFNTYNPIAERASDNEARKIRAAAAVGAF